MKDELALVAAFLLGMLAMAVFLYWLAHSPVAEGW